MDETFILYEPAPVDPEIAAFEELKEQINKKLIEAYGLPQHLVRTGPLRGLATFWPY